ncbi:MAG: hypothetical protein HY705_00220 [Gemmatimonadetes bacterium]|nr:hypothetical protein [Gemmatimonadota bacterium]
MRMPSPSRWFIQLLALALVGGFRPPPLPCQQVTAAPGRHEVVVGSELENYLRLLQLAGLSPRYPWSLRGFSPREVDRLVPPDTSHAWAGRFAPMQESPGRLRLTLLRPGIRVSVNSALPAGLNDGAVWTGRGLTTVFQGGLQVRYGPVSLTLDPIVFRSENGAFDLFDNGQTGRGRFGDGLEPSIIDQPQRFGEQPYVRVDPGQSTLRVELGGVAAAVSTANQFWGPALSHPLVLGNNAPGFVHAFVGTSRPVHVWIGEVHGRVVLGRLEQSEFSPVPADAGRRLMAGLVVLFMPRGAPGLELGASRFFHRLWPENGVTLRDFGIPFEGLLKSGLRRTDDPGDPRGAPDNQLASAFFRWAFPRSGVEVYGEFARNDHSGDLRDLANEPDHASAYALGLRKLWWRGLDQFVALRGEIVNARVSHLGRIRGQGRFYTHFRIVQGHTHRGQVLGSVAAMGGGGAVVALDWYHPRGRWTVEWNRIVRLQQLGEGADQDGWDVLHSVGVAGLFFRGRWELRAAVTGSYELNRNFGDDALNVNLTAGARVSVGGARR